MLNILRKNKEEEIRDLIFDKHFSSRRHKKIIKEAAKKSADDQRKLIDRYWRTISK